MTNVVEATVNFHLGAIDGMTKEEAEQYHERLRKEMRSKKADAATENVFRDVKNKLWLAIQEFPSDEEKVNEGHV